MADKELSPDAIRVLRDIHTRGLQVLWSFQVPHPEYDDETEMTREDWHIVHTVLGEIKYHHEYIVTSREQTINRRSLRNGAVFNERIAALPDGSELVLEYQVETGLYADGTADQVLSEETVYENHGQWIDYKSWESDYLEHEKIDQDDYTEEFVGLLHRYTLTDLAKQLIS